MATASSRLSVPIISPFDVSLPESWRTVNLPAPREEQQLRLKIAQTETALSVLVGKSPREIVENNTPRGKSLSEITLIPDVPEGYTLIVSDATGIELFRTTDPAKDIPARLKPGLFRFSLLAPDGTVTLVGVYARQQ